MDISETIRLLNKNLRGELTPEVENNMLRRTNYVATDGLMNMLNTKKGDQFDFFKEALHNQIHKRLLSVNLTGALKYIHSFENDEISAKSHGMNDLVHYYAKIGDSQTIEKLLEAEIRNPKFDSIFDSLDIQGRNATYLAYINGKYDIVRKLVEQGYHSIAPVTEILKIFIKIIKEDDVKEFVQLYYHGFDQLETYLTFDGKNLAHLVIYLSNMIV